MAHKSVNLSTNFPINDVNRDIASDVIMHNSNVGQFYKCQIYFSGYTIEYTSFGTKQGVVNVGTYYILQ